MVQERLAALGPSPPSLASESTADRAPPPIPTPPREVATSGKPPGKGGGTAAAGVPAGKGGGNVAKAGAGSRGGSGVHSAPPPLVAALPPFAPPPVAAVEAAPAEDGDLEDNDPPPPPRRIYARPPPPADSRATCAKWCTARTCNAPSGGCVGCAVCITFPQAVRTPIGLPSPSAEDGDAAE
eukprot:3158147-Prymnesium_polylepis.1